MRWKSRVKDDVDLLLRIRQDKMRRVKNGADVLLRIRTFFCLI